MQVCDRGGDPCDDVCGGAGCGSCGGFSCDEGAVTQADLALKYAKDAKNLIQERETKIGELYRGVKCCSNYTCWEPLLGISTAMRKKKTFWLNPDCSLYNKGPLLRIFHFGYRSVHAKFRVHGCCCHLQFQHSLNEPNIECNRPIDPIVLVEIPESVSSKPNLTL